MNHRGLNRGKGPVADVAGLPEPGLPARSAGLPTVGRVISVGFRPAAAGAVRVSGERSADAEGMAGRAGPGRAGPTGSAEVKASSKRGGEPGAKPLNSLPSLLLHPFALGALFFGIDSFRSSWPSLTMEKCLSFCGCPRWARPEIRSSGHPGLVSAESGPTAMERRGGAIPSRLRADRERRPGLISVTREGHRARTTSTEDRHMNVAGISMQSGGHGSIELR